jgi:hypothetical protein
MKRVVGSLVVCVSILGFVLAFLPWVHASAALVLEENAAIESPPELTIVVSPLRRAIGMKPVDSSLWAKHFEFKGQVRASEPAKPALQYGMFFLIPLVLLGTGAACVKGKSDDWFRWAKWTLLVSLIGAVLTIQRGIHDHLELDIQAGLGMQATITYETTVWAWLCLFGYLVAMIAAGLVLIGWNRDRARSHDQQD